MYFFVFLHKYRISGYYYHYYLLFVLCRASAYCLKSGLKSTHHQIHQNCLNCLITLVLKVCHLCVLSLSLLS